MPQFFYSEKKHVEYHEEEKEEQKKPREKNEVAHEEIRKECYKAQENTEIYGTSYYRRRLVFLGRDKKLFNILETQDKTGQENRVQHYGNNQWITHLCLQQAIDPGNSEITEKSITEGYSKKQRSKGDEKQSYLIEYQSRNKPETQPMFRKISDIVLGLENNFSSVFIEEMDFHDPVSRDETKEYMAHFVDYDSGPDDEIKEESKGRM